MAARNASLKPKIYFIRDAEEVTRRNRLTLRRWWQKKLFPTPSLINNRLAWDAEVIEQWIKENLQGFTNGANDVRKF